MFSKILAFYCQVINRLVYWIGASTSVLMPILAFTVAFEVFSRYVLGEPTIWAYDVSLFLFGYIAALGGALAQQNKAHINVDVLYLSVSARVRCFFNLISYSLAIFFLAVVLMMSFGKFEEAMEFNYRRQSEWAPSMTHFWVMMVVACGAFILQFVSDTIQDGYYLLTGKMLIEQEQESTEQTSEQYAESAGDV
ncbi:TRAP transporter small permease subunit [Vibrio alfacsensis]|jgi:TRAP-type C4-dicarboxylate transport system permease small subunit|uniref:TRAP transporter small permease subunit n=1 Tax=Vibrio alfacsensis TaxID=1074311 RepID=UPI00406889D8